MNKIISFIFFSSLILISCAKDGSDENMNVDVPNVDLSDNDVETDDSNNTNDLSERYVFDGNIVIENSYNTGGCDSPPCDTNDESLITGFSTGIPDDPYFYLSDDQSELFLLSQQQEGRRIEFKQRSEGSLNSFSQIELEGKYYDVPNTGITIAQVHNRGGSGNKPFFRLVLYTNGLETVIRRDPEVSSSETSFSKEDYSFINNSDYNLFTLKTTIEKSNGSVHIKVEQDGTEILNESYAPETTTRWVTDSGIANGYYLKAGIYNDDGDHTDDIIAGFTSVKYESDDD